ncbi:MAG: hypothetical protein KC619_27365 [Myxococcales bacterium]|nr:hypothetical protein [Myxococcales bacterium]
MAKPKRPDDVALVLGATEGAEKLAVLRKRGDKVEAAVLAKAEEGKPVHGDLVRLSAREEPHLYDVETIHEAPKPDASTTPTPTGARSGPAQVASPAYREGWDRIFPAKRRRALN